MSEPMIGHIEFGPPSGNAEFWRVEWEKEQRLHAVLRAAVKEFFALLDATEESDEGRAFHPVMISCCRVMLTSKVEIALAKMKYLAL